MFAEITGILTGHGYATYLPPQPEAPLVDRSSDRLPNVVAVPDGVAIPPDYRPLRLVA